jgi:hypothetical protein
MQTGTGADQLIGAGERRRFRSAHDPSQVGSAAAWTASARGHHGRRDVDRVHLVLEGSHRPGQGALARTEI